MNTRKFKSIIKQIQQGDKEAFAEIYLEFYQAVYYLALRITNSQADAMDIVQETMLTVYSKLDQIYDAERLKVYIHRIAYNRCIDLLRKRDKIVIDWDSENSLNALEDQSDAINPEKHIEKLTTREELIDRINMLDESYRIVILLHYYQQLSVKQIAEILDLSVENVKVRLFRARGQLKKTLSEKAMKGGFAVVMLPKITRTLQADAQAMCGDQIKLDLWNRIQPGLQMDASSAQQALHMVNTSSQSLGMLSTAAKITAVSVAGIGIGVITAVNLTAPIEQEVSLPEAPASICMESAPVQQEVSLILPAQVLYYTVGEEISAQSVLEKSQAYISPDHIGEALQLRVEFDELEESIPGEYGAYIFAEGGQVTLQSAVILILE